MEYAIISLKGKQYRVQEQSSVKVDNLNLSSGELFSDYKVLLYFDGKNYHVGTPYVSGVEIDFNVDNTEKDKKILVLKYKRKKGYQRLYGHRQTYTYLKVDKIRYTAMAV